MSDSYHVNRTDLKRLSKKELDDMALDPHSLLQQWAEKSSVKAAVKKTRNTKKKQDKFIKRSGPRSSLEQTSGSKQNVTKRIQVGKLFVSYPESNWCFTSFL